MTTRNLLVATLLALLVSLCACSSSPAKKDGEAPPRRERVSPLGLGNPDPEIMFEDALAAISRGDIDTYLSHFAVIDPNTRQLIVANKYKDERAVQDVEKIKRGATTLQILGDPNVAVTHYGSPRNVRNTPPTVRVPVTRIYMVDQMTEGDRERLVGAMNAVRPEGAPQIDWAALQKRLEDMPKATEMSFVYLDGGWRFLSL